MEGRMLTTLSRAMAVKRDRNIRLQLQGTRSKERDSVVNFWVGETWESGRAGDPAFKQAYAAQGLIPNHQGHQEMAIFMGQTLAHSEAWIESNPSACLCLGNLRTIGIRMLKYFYLKFRGLGLCWVWPPLTCR